MLVRAAQARSDAANNICWTKLQHANVACPSQDQHAAPLAHANTAANNALNVLQHAMLRERGWSVTGLPASTHRLLRTLQNAANSLLNVLHICFVGDAVRPNTWPVSTNAMNDHKLATPPNAAAFIVTGAHILEAESVAWAPCCWVMLRWLSKQMVSSKACLTNTGASCCIATAYMAARPDFAGAPFVG